MRKNNPVEDELNAIRMRHYEQTKGMTTGEYVAYMNRRGEEILKPYGIKPVHMDIVRSVQ
jgi:hypothetical protein